jgi:hypothetical protein
VSFIFIVVTVKAIHDSKIVRAQLMAQHLNGIGQQKFGHLFVRQSFDLFGNILERAL